MSALGDGRRAVAISMREISITAASRIEANRLADALPAALERALLPPKPAADRRTAADRVAAEIVRQLESRVRRAERGA